METQGKELMTSLIRSDTLYFRTFNATLDILQDIVLIYISKKEQQSLSNYRLF